MNEAGNRGRLAHQIPGDIASGAWIEIKCLSIPVRSGNRYTGEWGVNICVPENEKTVVRHPFVDARNHLPRTFKSVPGLMSLCIEHGLTPFVLPLRKGEISVWEKPERKR